MNNCPHLHVTIYTRMTAPETRWDEAEYLVTNVCDDCGAELDKHQIPEEAEVKDGRE